MKPCLSRGFSLLALVTLAGCAAPSPGAGSESTGSTRGALVNGSIVSDDMLRSGVLFWANSVGPWCTGVRVGPRQFLTAAHCVVTTTSGQKLTTTLRADFVANAPIWYTRASSVPASDASMFIGAYVASTSLPPGYRTACAGIGCSPTDLYGSAIPDMAVVTIDRDIDSTVYEAYVDTTALYDEETVTLSGYGCIDGSFVRPDPIELRYGTSNTITQSEAIAAGVPLSPTNAAAFSLVYAITPGASFNGISSNHTPALCPGDSGGPLYRGAAGPGGAELVVGINGAILPDTAQISQVNYHTRTAERGIVEWLTTLLPAGSFYSE